MVRVEDQVPAVRGTGRVKLFRRGQAPVWVPAATPLPLPLQYEPGVGLARAPGGQASAGSQGS